MPRETFSRRANAELIVRALHQLEVPANVNERHDIVIDGRKISGSAYKLITKRAYHHGTMLIDTDLHQLGQYLHVDKPNIVTKGVESVRSSVARLREHSLVVDHLSYCKAVAEEFDKTYRRSNDRLPPIIIEPSIVDAVSEVKAYREEILHWNWTYGQTPEFIHTLEKTFDGFGNFSMKLKSRHGIITEATVDFKPFPSSTSASLAVAWKEIGGSLEGCHYSEDGVDQGFKQAIRTISASLDDSSTPCAPSKEIFLAIADELRSWVHRQL